jgi:hypothetical protein
MPRSVKDDPRDCFKTFRFTASELTRLEARARARGQTLSSYVRTVMLGRDAIAGAAETDEFPPPNPAYPGIRRPSSRADLSVRTLAEQLRRVGTNLNQIARRMNELHIPPPRDLTMLLDQIRTLVRQAREP